MNGESIRMETVYKNDENDYSAKVINYQSSANTYIELPVDDDEIYKNYQNISAKDFYSETNNSSGLRFADIPIGTLVYNDRDLVGRVSDKTAYGYKHRHAIEIEIAESNEGAWFYSHFIDDMEHSRTLYKISVHMYGNSEEENKSKYIINIESTKLNLFHKTNYVIIPINYDCVYINDEKMEIDTDSIEYLRGLRKVIADNFYKGTDVNVYRDNEIFNETSYIGAIGKVVTVVLDEENKMLLMCMNLNHDNNSNDPEKIEELARSIYNNLNKFSIGINLYVTIFPDMSLIYRDERKRSNIYLLYN